MFQKTDTPILGVIENMAYFEDPSTGAPIEIFGRGGAQRVARELGAPFLGEVPIDIALRASGDEGRPITASAPASPCAQRILAIAQALAERLGAGDLQKPPPRIRTV
jgi:ATP-binding protein involved in chromosome partitioning